MSNIVFYICSFFIMYNGFTEITPQKLGLNPTFAGWITNFIFLFILYNCRSTLRNFFCGDYKFINIIVSCYCLWMVYSVFRNQQGSIASSYMQQIEYMGLEVQGVKDVFWKSVNLFSVILFFETICKNQKVKLFLKFAFQILLIYVIYIDVLMFWGYDRNSYGGKFIISYTHLYLAVIYHRLHPFLSKKTLYIYILLLCTILFMGLYMRCSTILVALFPFAILTLWKPAKKNKSKLYNISIFLTSLIICNVVLFFFSAWLLSFDFVQKIIVDILNEDLTLTGRLGIYETIVDVFADSPWYGMGVGNYIGVSMAITGCANAQNGIVNLFLEVGIIGCFLFVCLLIQLIKKARLYSVSYPIIAFVYAELVVSMVEIPFSYMSFWIMAFFLLLHNENDLRFPITKS